MSFSRFSRFCCCFFACLPAIIFADTGVNRVMPSSVLRVKVPYMELVSFHRVYADALLELALELTIDEFGPYEIVLERSDKAIRRQLLELENGDSLSVSVAMPTSEWLAKTNVVQFPVLKGLASYRMFFSRKQQEPFYSAITDVNALKKLSFGQGLGWSTGRILEDSGFKVVYGGVYSSLIPMMKFGRFDLFMRSVYEMEPELIANQSIMSDLKVVDGIAAYTYLPMYYFVSKKQPQLSKRLHSGLLKAHETGQFDLLFRSYFEAAIGLLNERKRTVFYLQNTNIDANFFTRDKPYLLDTIRSLGDVSKR